MMKARILSLLVTCSLVACTGGEFADLRQFVDESGKNMAGRIEPIPAVKAYEPFAYGAFDLPDPFKPRKITTATTGGGLQPDVNRRKEPLEAYPLESLKMVGTLNRDRAFFALIKTPDNILARVKNGNYMGQNFGQVLEITESQVKLKEIVQDPAGDWSERVSTLQLQDEQEQRK
jgi:type IV pilus assembly protein PilP